MSNEYEIFKFGDQVCHTGLLMPNASEKLLMANVEVYPDKYNLDDKDIQRALVINGKQRAIADRERRQKRMRNQGNLGKCNASSNTSGVENLREDQGFPEEPLSDCYVYSAGNRGTDSGMALITTLTQMCDVGVAPMRLQVAGVEKVLPNDFYNRKQVDSAIIKQADIEAKRFMGFEYFKAPTNSIESFARCLASAVARKHQIIFAWHVGSNSSRLNGDYAIVGRGPGNHSNLGHSGWWIGGKYLIDLDDQNSWGPTVDPMYGRVGGAGWGQKGFAKFRMEDVFACTGNHCCYVATSARIDRNDPAFQTAS